MSPCTLLYLIILFICLTCAKGDGDDVEKGTKKQQSAGRFTELEVFTQAFTLTFLAEWGDRSQIATIALAASKNVFGVFFGGLIGHAFCTGLAVIGGRLLAGLYVCIFKNKT